AESGMTDSLANEYSDGTQKVGVILRQFRDPSGAYEAYTAEFGPNMHPSTVGGPSAIDQERLLLLLGNLILEVRPPQNPTTDELQQLAAMVRNIPARRHCRRFEPICRAGSRMERKGMRWGRRRCGM